MTGSVGLTSRTKPSPLGYISQVCRSKDIGNTSLSRLKAEPSLTVFKENKEKLEKDILDRGSQHPNFDPEK